MHIETWPKCLASAGFLQPFEYDRYVFQLTVSLRTVPVRTGDSAGPGVCRYPVRPLNCGLAVGFRHETG